MTSAVQCLCSKNIHSAAVIWAKNPVNRVICSMQIFAKNLLLLQVLFGSEIFAPKSIFHWRLTSQCFLYCAVIGILV